MACGGSNPVGILLDTQNKPVPNNLVRLITVDDSGDETTQISTTTTDTNGKFFFDFSHMGNASLVLESDLPSGTVRSFMSGRNGHHVPLSPITTALVTLVQNMTRTTGGRSFTDFSAQELQELTEALLNLGLSNLDLSDQENIENFIRTSSLARKIAEASGGQITSISFSNSDSISSAVFSSNVSICGSGSPIFVLEGSSFRYDVRDDATLCGGSHDSFENMFLSGALTLAMPDRSFFTYGGESFPSTGLGVYNLEDNREVVFGPYALEKIPENDMSPVEADTLLITRKIFVPENQNYARFLTTFENTGSSTQTLEIEWRSFLETGNSSSLLSFDTSEALPTTKDRFVVVYDNSQNRPTVGFAFQDGLNTSDPDLFNFPGKAGGQVNELTVGWNAFDVPPQTSKTFLHYVLYSDSRNEEELKSVMTSLVESPDMDGLSLEELQNLVNFSPRKGTLVGEAGSVIGRVTVSATNLRTLTSLSVISNRDGSFAIPIETQSGDTLTLTSEDGLTQTFLAP